VAGPESVGPVIAIVGPTASGKTALSLELAALMGGADAVEIVSADAMQLYRGMDIGTAKVPPADRRGIRHRQIDVLDVTQEASVAAYQRHAGKMARFGIISLRINGRQRHGKSIVQHQKTCRRQRKMQGKRYRAAAMPSPQQPAHRQQDRKIMG